MQNRLRIIDRESPFYKRPYIPASNPFAFPEEGEE
jgi:hypothetical protein